MPARGDRKVLVIALSILLVFQTIIFASVPGALDESRINVVVKSGTSLYGIARMLKDEGMIYSTNLFVLASLLYGGKLKAGEYEVSKDMSTLQIVRKMAHSERNVYTLKIVQGYNIYTVADAIAENRIMEKQEFLRLCRDRIFLKNLGINADSLEGYLSPDTYYYSREIDADKFIEKIAQRTLRFFEKADVRERMRAENLDVNQTLTLASMIEKEAKMSTEKPLISAVFHNRLQRGMSFDSDPTVIYGTKAFGSPITKADLITYTPYNTYTFRGFPKGPICNPDTTSIMAVLYPAPVDYLYFVSKNDGTHVFSKDMNEHNKYVAMYQKSKSAKK
ncbi:MAG TPA: endolytic transglycosylase MltG [Syntrophorhabdaceae bacterium]|nr:endolytic transglycosylase MltG [Syntrophorhabdaceae bacterium]